MTMFDDIVKYVDNNKGKSLPTIAGELGLNVRTLQRRLSDAGYTRI